MLIIHYLLAVLAFVVIYLAERLILFWLKKKEIWPLIDYRLLVDGITYTVIFIVLIGVLHITFKKINTINLLWLDASIYLFVRLIRPGYLFFVIKNKEKFKLENNHLLGASILVVILLECFVFNSKASRQEKEVYEYQSFITESLTSDGIIENDKIILTNKQCIYINTEYKEYDSIYLHFNNDDMNLYINVFEKKTKEDPYTFKKYVLIDPTIDAYGHISLDGMNEVKYLKFEFDIDNSRYLNDSTKPTLIVDKISFDAYFPLIINPLRLGGLFILLTIGFRFKKLFIDDKVKEDLTIYQKLERAILFSGIIVLVYFVIEAIINNSAYFIKYDELYLGGTSSNNIYYQQFDAYLKGQLHIDIEADPRLAELENPYDPGQRGGISYLWDHAYFNGKYYSYYGHGPIFLVMLPIYWISRYVPSNLFVLQLGVLVSIFAFVLAALQIIKLFVKKTSTPILVLTLIAMVFGSLLFTNTTYEYGGMVYRIPYAYANAFLFLTIYLFMKGYYAEKGRVIYFSFTALSLVFIVLSRPIEVLYLALFIPVIIRMIMTGFNNKKQLLIDYIPAISIVLIGAIIVCVMNYIRFDSILEFGEHYQLTVTDCTKNHLDIDGILPTIYHYFLQRPKWNEKNKLLTYRWETEHFEYHSYTTCSVGLVFVPISLLMLLIPFVTKKEDGIPFIVFAIGSPIIILSVAFISYCFAGACPRYLLDFAPWVALTGGLMGLKAIEKDNGKHPVVPSLISVVLIISIIMSAQYHFIEFDGLRIGDYNGLLGLVKTITNQYDI